MICFHSYKSQAQEVSFVFLSLLKKKCLRKKLCQIYKPICQAGDCFRPQCWKKESILSECLTCSVFIRQAWATVSCATASTCFSLGFQTKRCSNGTACVAVRLYIASGCLRRRRHHVKCYCSTARTWRLSAHSLLTYDAHAPSALSNRGPTAARHSWHQMRFKMQWARGLHARTRLQFAQGIGASGHWIKSVVLVNDQGYLVQIKLGESHVWVVGFALQWCPAQTFVLRGFMSEMVKAELGSCHAVTGAPRSSGSQVPGEIR